MAESRLKHKNHGISMPKLFPFLQGLLYFSANASQPFAMVETRATYAQLCRAAGSQSLGKLTDALQGWTRDEIDALPENSNNGKNPVHMAAWQGCMENLQYLVETMGCDVNIIATGEFSYGKTPIFFATTRSRNDVVEYLLDMGAHVKIVNNKGQSVLSIAASHLESNVIQRIQQQEEAQQHVEWKNFRVTHSDGFDYGDLEPRFLDRPLRTTDVVTPLVVNPTTKSTRKNGFLKRNPHLAGAKPKRQQEKKPKSIFTKPSLTPQEEEQLESCWKRLLDGIPVVSVTTDDLERIIFLSDKRRGAWIQGATQRIKETGVDPDRIATMLMTKNITGRNKSLRDKLVANVLGIVNSACDRKQPRREHSTPSLSDGKWKEACDLVKQTSIRLFENGQSILSLPQTPTWVDSEVNLEALEKDLNAARLIAIDCEWFDESSNHTRISTLQIAVPAGSSQNVWILDLMAPEEFFQAKARSVVRKIFADGRILVLGFAIGHDTPKLEEWLSVNNDLFEIGRENVLDVQTVFGQGPQMPGLANCCQKYSSLPLSKQEQCSNWGQRPLRATQLEYAGLDAAILPALLAEVRADWESSKTAAA